MLDPAKWEECMTRLVVLAVAVILSAAPIGTAEAKGFWTAVGHAMKEAAEDARRESEKERPSARIIPKAAEEMGKGAAKGLAEEQDDKDDREESR
jgi:hypothetical protein